MNDEEKERELVGRVCAATDRAANLAQPVYLKRSEHQRSNVRELLLALRQASAAAEALDRLANGVPGPKEG